MQNFRGIIPKDLTEEEQIVCLQGFAGLLWTKQFYYYVMLSRNGEG